MNQSDMKHVVICRTDGTVEDMTMTEDHAFDWYAEQIGARIVQTVYPKGLKDPYLFLCDEEGLLREKPVINFLGSWMYGTHEHGEPIVGDIIIVKQVMTDEGPDFDGMPENEADVIVEWLLGSFWKAHHKVMAKIGRQLKKSS